MNLSDLKQGDRAYITLDATFVGVDGDGDAMLDIGNSWNTYITPGEARVVSVEKRPDPFKVGDVLVRGRDDSRFLLTKDLGNGSFSYYSFQTRTTDPWGYPFQHPYYEDVYTVEASVEVAA